MEKGKRMKKRTILYIAVAVLLLAVIAVSSFPIGSLAAEDREIRKDGQVLYVQRDNDYSSGDRGMFAGIVTRGDAKYWAFYVRGDRAREWLYVAAWGRGAFYQKVN